MIHWWKTAFGDEEIARLTESFRNQHISQGKVTEEFERKLSEYLQIDHVICTSSGSTALMLAFLAIGIKPGDEVIIPNRTWVATAHAAYLLGAKIVLVDVEENRPILDVTKVEAKISAKTKAIVPVHMNGRSVHMPELNALAKKHNIPVVEDAAQAIGSKNASGFLGTQSAVGCFSLSVAKTIATGQGGFAVTANKELADRLRALRTHGVENVKDPKAWVTPGFNFRFTDLQASIGIEQLKRLPQRLEFLRSLYGRYLEGLRDTPLKAIEVNTAAGETPVYIEYLCNDRENLIATLQSKEIDTRPFYPDLNLAPYFPQEKNDFPNSVKYGLNGVYLPGGPTQDLKDIQTVIDTIQQIYAKK